MFSEPCQTKLGLRRACINRYSGSVLADTKPRCFEVRSDLFFHARFGHVLCLYPPAAPHPTRNLPPPPSHRPVRYGCDNVEPTGAFAVSSSHVGFKIEARAVVALHARAHIVHCATVAWRVLGCGWIVPPCVCTFKRPLTSLPTHTQGRLFQVEYAEESVRVGGRAAGTRWRARCSCSQHTWTNTRWR